MKVTPYVINKGTSSEYWGLKSVEDDPRDSQVLHTPKWKSKKSAIKYAEKSGMEVVESSSKASRKFVVSATNISCSDLTDEQANTLYELSMFAEDTIRNVEKDYGKKLSPTGWGEVMDYAKEITKHPETYSMTGTDIDSAKLHFEAVIYDIYEDDTGIGGIYESTDIKCSSRRKYTQSKATVPEESAEDFKKFLDSIGIDYTTEDVPNGVEFMYGIYVGSKESNRIDKYLDKITSNIRGGTMKNRKFVISAGMSPEKFYTRDFPDVKPGQVKVAPQRGNYTVFIGLSDGTIAYQWCESKVKAEREAKYARDTVKKYGSDAPYWTAEGYKIWNPKADASTSAKHRFSVKASASAKRKAAIKAAANDDYITITFLFKGNSDDERAKELVSEAERLGGFGSTGREHGKVTVMCPLNQDVRKIEQLVLFAEDQGIFLNQYSYNLLDDKFNFGKYLRDGVVGAKSVKCATDSTNESEYHLYGYDKDGADVDTRYTRSANDIADAVDELFSYDEVDTVDIYRGGMSVFGDYIGTVTRDEHDSDSAGRVRELLEMNGIKGAKSVKCATDPAVEDFRDTWTRKIFDKTPVGVSTITVYFKDGRSANYTTEVFDDMTTDPSVDYIIDAETGELLYESENGVVGAKSIKCATIKASWYDGEDIVMYYNGSKIYEGQPGSDMYDTIKALCEDDSTRIKFQEWCDEYADGTWFSDEPENEYGDAGETAYIFCEIIYYDFVDGADYADGNGIVDFEIFPKSEEVTGAKSVKCSSRPTKRKTTIKASDYRQYEDPYALQERLDAAEAALAENPGDPDYAEEVADLRARLRFAWDDDEYEVDGSENIECSIVKSSTSIESAFRDPAIDKEAVRELVLTITNDGDLYREKTTPILENLKKKAAKGKYDRELAVKLWQYLADEGVRRYGRDFGSGYSVSWLNPATRQEIAKELRDYYEEQVLWDVNHPEDTENDLVTL